MTILLLVLAALQIGGAPATAPPGSAPANADFGPPELVCTIEDKQLDEASGIVAGRANPGLYYTHNDSGGKPIVYAIDRAGRIHIEWELAGATNMDWEDIALAPGGRDGPVEICVADIGDNDEKRSEVVIYRFAEPRLEKTPASQPSRQSVSPTRYLLRYADGPRNAEALLVHPRTGEGFVFSKRLDGTAEVYRIPRPWDKAHTIVMERIGVLNFPQSRPIETIVTAADISADGTQLVTRSYLCGWLWEAPTDRPRDFADLFRQTPLRLELAAEPQGEAICFSPDGRCLLTISEKSPTRLYESCRPKR